MGKPIEAFHFANKAANRRHTICGECHNRLYAKTHYARHREEYKARASEWYYDHPERVRQRRRDWKDRNREHVREKHRDYEARHPEVVARHVQERRARIDANPGHHTRRQFLQKCAEWGWRCAYCGIGIDRHTIQEDHVIPVVAGGSNGIANIVPACAPCNRRKGTDADWTPVHPTERDRLMAAGS